jgi:hypothetical protein
MHTNIVKSHRSELSSTISSPKRDEMDIDDIDIDNNLKSKKKRRINS